MPKLQDLTGVIAASELRSLSKPKEQGALAQKQDLVGLRDALTFPAAHAEIMTELVITEQLLNDMIPVRIYQQKTLVDRKLPTLIYLHGGAFIGGSMSSANTDAICRTFAGNAPIQVVNVEYRLAPEHPYPAGLMDCYQVVQTLTQQAETYQVDVDKLWISGDSAGGSLALTTAILDHSYYQTNFVKKILAYYPDVDLANHGQGATWNPENIFVKDPQQRVLYTNLINQISKLQPLVENLYGGATANLKNPLISPLYASAGMLQQLPPLMLIYGEFDMLRQQDEAFVQKLAEINRKPQVKIYPGLLHAFIDKVGVLPEAQAAILAGLAWLQQ